MTKQNKKIIVKVLALIYFDLTQKFLLIYKHMLVYTFYNEKNNFKTQVTVLSLLLYNF